MVKDIYPFPCLAGDLHTYLGCTIERRARCGRTRDERSGNCWNLITDKSKRATLTEEERKIGELTAKRLAKLSPEEKEVVLKIGENAFEYLLDGRINKFLHDDELAEEEAKESILEVNRERRRLRKIGKTKYQKFIESKLKDILKEQPSAIAK